MDRYALISIWYLSKLKQKFSTPKVEALRQYTIVLIFPQHLINEAHTAPFLQFITLLFFINVNYKLMVNYSFLKSVIILKLNFQRNDQRQNWKLKMDIFLCTKNN